MASVASRGCKSFHIYLFWILIQGVDINRDFTSNTFTPLMSEYFLIQLILPPSHLDTYIHRREVINALIHAWQKVDRLGFHLSFLNGSISDWDHCIQK